VLGGHVRHARGVQVLDEGFHSSAKGMLSMLYAILFKRPQHAIKIGCPSHIHGIFRQFIYGGEIACEPVSIGEIKMIAPSVEKSLTRF
jgi:hypothetical protein